MTEQDTRIDYRHSHERTYILVLTIFVNSVQRQTKILELHGLNYCMVPFLTFHSIIKGQMGGTCKIHPVGDYSKKKHIFEKVKRGFTSGSIAQGLSLVKRV
ncbi:unnamed protein product [Lupinus luteus]|uniref:Uncharacterized protein n=1 Tax=Lupinus luteus TaxID=3873 RepID=A0AAV1XKJ5_LUPLU